MYLIEQMNHHQIRRKSILFFEDRKWIISVVVIRKLSIKERHLASLGLMSEKKNCKNICV